MMHLRLNIGAIIKVKLLDGSSYAGKVDAVEEDELRLVDQTLVRGTLSSYDKEPFTVNRDLTIHIDREKIVCWRYAKITDFDDAFLDKDLDADIDGAKINHFGKDGFCKGNGKNCSTI